MKELEKYLLNRESGISQVLGNPEESCSRTTFHQLRVELKKLNALFELMDFCVKGFKRNKTFRPFKQIFRQAGKIREIQIETELLKKYFHDNLPVCHLQKLEDNRIQEQTLFFTLVGELSPARTDRTYRHLMRLLTRTGENKVAGFMKKTRKNITNSLLNTDLNPEQIHELRKLLKSYYYLDNCLEPATTSATPAAMADLTDLLGKWHDWHVIEAHLAETADSDGAASDEVTRITAIRAGILLEKEILMDKIKIAISTSEFVESQ